MMRFSDWICDCKSRQVADHWPSDIATVGSPNGPLISACMASAAAACPTEGHHDSSTHRADDELTQLLFRACQPSRDHQCLRSSQYDGYRRTEIAEFKSMQKESSLFRASVSGSLPAVDQLLRPLWASPH